MPVSSNAGLLLNLIGSFIGDTSPEMRKGSYDAQGNLIPGSLPYSDPGWATKFFHPDVAQTEVGSNDQVRQLIAKSVNLANAKRAATGTELGQTNIASIPGEDPTGIASFYGPGGQSSFNKDIEAASGRKEVDPSIIGPIAARTSLASSKIGEGAANFQLGQQPVVQGTEATRNLIAQGSATGELNRQPLTQKVLDAQMINELSKQTGLDPLQIQLAKTEVERQLGREATVDDTKDILAQAQKYEANTTSALAKTKQLMIPALTGGLENQIRTTAGESAHPAPMANPYNINPRTQSLERNPLFMPTIPQIMPKLTGEGGGRAGGGVVPVGNGMNIVPQGASIDEGTTTKSLGSVPNEFFNAPLSPSKGFMTAAQFASEMKKRTKGQFDRTKAKNSMDTLINHLSANFPLPASMEGKNPNKVFMEALQGKIPEISPDDISKYIESLPPEEQHQLYQQVLKAGE